MMQLIAECLLHVQVEVRLRVIHYSKKMLGTCSQASTAKVRGEKIAPALWHYVLTWHALLLLVQHAPWLYITP